LCGHSFGTVLGVLAAARVPRRVGAWVGCGQVVDWALQEERSYRWALEEAKRRGDRRAVDALTQIGAPREGVYASGRSGTETQRRHLAALGGVSQPASFMLRWVLSLMLARDYPLRTKLQFSKAMARSMDLVWPELGRRIDFARDIGRLDVPVHVFQGDADRITDLAQVEAWIEALDAPLKRLEVVPGAGHLAPFERPERFVAFLEGVRAQVA
jgi:pimeloyl-ACP methyl ester carboxylesterase